MSGILLGDAPRHERHAVICAAIGIDPERAGSRARAAEVIGVARGTYWRALREPILNKSTIQGLHRLGLSVALGPDLVIRVWKGKVRP